MPADYYTTPIGQAALAQEGNDLSIITYGLGVHWALAACKELAVQADILDLRTLLPWDSEAVGRSVRKTGRVLILHEDTLAGAWAGEIAAWIAEHCFASLDAPCAAWLRLIRPCRLPRSWRPTFCPSSGCASSCGPCATTSRARGPYACLCLAQSPRCEVCKKAARLRCPAAAAVAAERLRGVRFVFHPHRLGTPPMTSSTKARIKAAEKARHKGTSLKAAEAASASADGATDPAAPPAADDAKSLSDKNKSIEDMLGNTYNTKTGLLKRSRLQRMQYDGHKLHHYDTRPLTPREASRENRQLRKKGHTDHGKDAPRPKEKAEPLDPALDTGPDPGPPATTPAAPAAPEPKAKATKAVAPQPDPTEPSPEPEPAPKPKKSKDKKAPKPDPTQARARRVFILVSCLCLAVCSEPCCWLPMRRPR